MDNNLIIPSQSDIQILEKIGKYACDSGYLPAGIRTPQQAVIIALKGKELGIPPMQAFSQIAVVNGKPTISAELMVALVYKNIPTAEIKFEKNNNEECLIKARRKLDHDFSEFSFTMNDAKLAGLLGKDVWKKYPSSMLRARAISAMCRALFADAISGCSYTPEELEPTPKEKKEEEKQDTINITPPKEEKSKIEEVYRIPFGKPKGLTLEEIPHEDLKNYISQCYRKAAGAPFTEQVKEFIDRSEAYLKQFEEDSSWEPEITTI